MENGQEPARTLVFAPAPNVVNVHPKPLAFPKFLHYLRKQHAFYFPVFACCKGHVAYCMALAFHVEAEHGIRERLAVVAEIRVRALVARVHLKAAREPERIIALYCKLRIYHAVAAKRMLGAKGQRTERNVVAVSRIIHLVRVCGIVRYRAYYVAVAAVPPLTSKIAYLVQVFRNFCQAGNFSLFKLQLPKFKGFPVRYRALFWEFRVNAKIRGKHHWIPKWRFKRVHPHCMAQHPFLVLAHVSWLIFQYHPKCR